MLDHRRVGEAGVGATLLLGDVGVELREALDVGLVDHGLGVRHVQLAVTGPVEERVDDDAEHHVRRRVLVVEGVRVVELVGEQRRVPVDLPVHRLGVGIEQQLRRVGPQPAAGSYGAVHPVAVALTRLHLRQVAVPHVGVDVDELDPRLDAVVVEQAQLDPLGDLAEQREVRAAAVERRAQWVRGPGPTLHHVTSRRYRLGGGGGNALYPSTWRATHDASGITVRVTHVNRQVAAATRSLAALARPSDHLRIRSPGHVHRARPHRERAPERSHRGGERERDRDR